MHVQLYSLRERRREHEKDKIYIPCFCFTPQSFSQTNADCVALNFMYSWLFSWQTFVPCSLILCHYIKPRLLELTRVKWHGRQGSEPRRAWRLDTRLPLSPLLGPGLVWLTPAKHGATTPHRAWRGAKNSFTLIAIAKEQIQYPRFTAIPCPQLPPGPDKGLQ